MEGGSCPVVATAATADYSIGLTRYWGILKWPSLGEFGWPPGIDWNQVIFKGLIIKGVYGREMFETWYKMIAMVQGGLDLTPIITHRFAVGDYLKGFETMASGHSGKVVLSWD
jgi:threonine dehydrogenase-like Zn-dependent dehydrogenase